MTRTLVLSAACMALMTAAPRVEAQDPTGWTLYAQYMTRSPAGQLRPLMMRSTSPFPTEEACARKALEIREAVPIGMQALNDGSVVVAMRFRCEPAGTRS